MTNFRYEELKWPEVGEAALRDPVVVLPVGTMEQHGPHLPLLVDYIIPHRIANDVAELLTPDVIVMPPVVYSFNEHHMDFPGTIAINMYTIIDYVAQIGFSLAHHGFRHIVLLNGHGSNVPVLDLAMRRINNESPAISVLANYWALVRDEDLPWARESHGVAHHAEEDETSLMLYLCPHLVDMSKAVRTVEEVQRSEHIWGACRPTPRSSSRSSIAAIRQPAFRATPLSPPPKGAKFSTRLPSSVRQNSSRSSARAKFARSAISIPSRGRDKQALQCL